MIGNYKEYENKLKSSLKDSKKFKLEKIIYAKIKPTTKDQIIEIMTLERDTHLRKYPELEFVGMEMQSKTKTSHKHIF